jgi:methylated-DNA-[protein]-cysteine S-methyltransferase
MQKSLLFIDTPAGRFGMVEEDEAITQVFFENEGVLLDARLEETKLLKKAGQQLQEYFAGRREIFDLPLAPKGTTFQLEVWRALQNIPYGETRSYKDIAAAVGNYKASRAVGMANHHNPIAIIIPCHRVIGSNGRLVGYGGGLDVKDYLLNLEKQYVLMKKNPN